MAVVVATTTEVAPDTDDNFDVQRVEALVLLTNHPVQKPNGLTRTMPAGPYVLPLNVSIGSSFQPFVFLTCASNPPSTGAWEIAMGQSKARIRELETHLSACLREVKAGGTITLPSIAGQLDVSFLSIRPLPRSWKHYFNPASLCGGANGCLH